MKTTGRIAREGKIHFHDASLSVWEEGIPREWDAKEIWERHFKREVFARIVQCLRRLGWTVTMPAIDAHSVKHYGGKVARQSAEAKRFCQKGDLKGDLSTMGRTIDFKMFQSVNCPTRADHEGRYEWNKEACMPYLVRLEMERTRRRIRTHLCNVFTDYAFDSSRAQLHKKPLQYTALERINQRYAESCHFKGANWDQYKTKPGMSFNLQSADRCILEHGQRVWFADHKGRMCEGTALYNINNMWWVMTGRYDFTNVANFDLYTKPPENLRTKRNAKQRSKRLQALLADAVKAMNFERAAVLRDIAFPKGEPLFVVWHDEHQCYHRTEFRGYTKSLVDAGKFTAQEVKAWNKAPNRVLPMAMADEERKAA